MKNLWILLALFMTAAYPDAETPEEREVPIEDVFSPLGFDSNDRSEIIVTGVLPNLCHKSPNHEIKIVDKKIMVTVTSLYYDESNPFCPELEVPFTEVVNLGILNKGDYEVVVNQKTKHEKNANLLIEEAKSGAMDSFHYALVDYVEKKEGSRKVNLVGYNPSDCFELDKIDYLSNGKDTLSVLPKMKQVKPFCAIKMTPFKFEFEVPTVLKKQKILLHVRKMDGRSENVVFDQAMAAPELSE
ncbi:hypothetical protein N9N67_01365 [Bacteriovoracaceae bacterium]|nr:hypothetical protein [Bacteriovoracaceae bacterium]